MKKIAFILILAFCWAGCSSSADSAHDKNSVNAGNGANTGEGSNTTGQMVPYNGVDPEAFNGNTSNVRVVEVPEEKQKTKFDSRPAPDQSEFSTTMNKKGEVLETRTFKDHPQILKIERKTAGKENSLKVYLKNGKVYDLSEEKVPNFRVAAPQNILIAIGVTPKPEAKPKPEGETEKKKEGQ
ncbi:MAG: hypothetical protein R2747_19995 [Pyrinomonadaceae bacterium]